MWKYSVLFILNLHLYTEAVDSQTLCPILRLAMEKTLGWEPKKRTKDEFIE